MLLLALESQFQINLRGDVRSIGSSGENIFVLEILFVLSTKMVTSSPETAMALVGHFLTKLRADSCAIQNSNTNDLRSFKKIDNKL